MHGKLRFNCHSGCVPLATILIVWLLAQSVFNKDNLRRCTILVLASVRSNNVGFGFPICVFAMGKRGEELVPVYFVTSIIEIRILKEEWHRTFEQFYRIDRSCFYKTDCTDRVYMDPIIPRDLW